MALLLRRGDVLLPDGWCTATDPRIDGSLIERLGAVRSVHTDLPE